MDKLELEPVNAGNSIVRNARTKDYVCAGDPIALQEIVDRHNNQIDKHKGVWWVDLEQGSTINVGKPPNDSVIASGDAEVLELIVQAMGRTLNVFRKLELGATLPTRGSDGSGGFDLYTPEAFTLRPDAEEAYVVKTKVGVVLPQGHHMQFWARSSLGKRRVVVYGGFIDYDYRNELGVMLGVDGPKALSFAAGDRVAQCAIIPCLMPGVVSADRGGGFGSTGR